VKPGRRVSVLCRAVFLLLAATSVCRGAWDFTAPGEPNRNWSAAVATGVEYDDNFNSTEFHRQSGYRLTSDLTLRAKVVGQRSLLSGQYDYGLLYPNYNHVGGVNQSHSLNASATYAVNPRLFLSLNEIFVDSIQPQLVQTIAKVPVTIVQAGTYIYDFVGTGASYSLTRRWTMSCAGNWDIWRYQEAAFATNNDHEDYSMTLSALYSLDPRTVVGVNYQYAASTYTHPGPKNSLNSDANTGYLSLTRQFNPRLSLAVNGGYTVRTSGDGSSSTAPSAYGALVYNYGPASTIALTGAESLNAATVGTTGGFSAQENTSFNLQVNHRFTARLHTIIEGSYVYSTFILPVVGQTLVPQNVSPSEQSMVGHWGIAYDFRQWLFTTLDYSYTRLISSNANLAQPYSRDTVSVRVVLAY
jgi:hypothetical protein